ncbi:uncharacterized protein LOC132714099 [Ruditapes philippinarum]|uniref:uncharacterized protein LOC132714099 n=1 Tax=Ruditapes philippinarum TaxID=129788 RepID=UPI00295AD7E8|nr:uncharacterized protein LOC132714099 [Ruditapes philippinarum]
MYDKTRYSPDYYRYKMSINNKRSFQNHFILGPNKMKRLKRLQMEYEILKATGEHEVPYEMNTYLWRDIVLSPSKDQRMLLYKDILSEQKDLYVMEIRMSEIEVEMLSYINAIEQNGYTDKSMLLVDDNCVRNRQHIQDISTDMCNYNLSQDLVIDFGVSNRNLEQNMPRKLDDLRLTLEMNRRHVQSFKIHIANCGQVEKCDEDSKIVFDNIMKDFPLVSYHDGHIFNEFKKDRLVFFTPWVKDDIKEINDCVPVLLLENQMYTNDYDAYNAVLNSRGINKARLPVNHYVRFLGAHNNYFFSVVENIGVLQDMNIHHDWQKATIDNMLLPSYKYEIKKDEMKPTGTYRKNNIDTIYDILESIQSKN